MNEKDRRLLAELDKDARLADSTIAKRIGTSKQVIRYRIKRLREQGVIEGFYATIDVGAFGLASYYLFLQFQHLTREQEQALFAQLRDREDVGWLVTGTGRWDAVLLLYARSIAAFEQQLSSILLACGTHLHEHAFTILVGAEHLRYKFLPSTAIPTAQQTTAPRLTAPHPDTLAILDAIAQDARAPVTALAAKAGLPTHVVRYRLRECVRNGTITGFKPKLDIHAFGLQWHLLLLALHPTTPERMRLFLAACRDHVAVYYVTRTIGTYNLMLDLHVHGIEEFRDTLAFLKERFADIIKTYESVTVFAEHKIDYLPKAMVAQADS